MWLWFLFPRDRWSQEVLSTSFTTSLTCFINLFDSHNPDQVETPDTMQFSAVYLLCLTAAAVDAAAVTKRACVNYVGNSWGCDAPAGVAPNWNYCQAANPDYPVCGSPYI